MALSKSSIAAILVLAAGAAAIGAAKAAEPAGRPPALEPDQAGPDYKVQGEYLGEVAGAGGAKAKFASQVVAKGNGTFRAVLLAGGLPGAGWDGTSWTELQGRTDGEKTVLAAADGAGPSETVTGEVMTGKTTAGETFELKKVVRESPTLGAKPPPGAVVLFDGTGTDAWDSAAMDDRKLLGAQTGAGPTTKRPVRDFTMHLEFRIPFQPVGGAHGNSGIYIQQRYEMQIIDSFGEKPYKGGCGAIYQQVPPKVNMTLPPLAWQTYDLDFKAPRFDASGKKTANAVITVRLNGIVVHENQEIVAKTGAGKAEGPDDKPILLQSHGSPVFFRNIWILEKK